MEAAVDYCDIQDELLKYQIVEEDSNYDTVKDVLLCLTTVFDLIYNYVNFQVPANHLISISL